jgi:hypothetical protein
MYITAFGLRKEVVRGWRKVHNEEFYILYPSPSIIRTLKTRRMRLAEHVTWIKRKRNACRILVGKPEGKKPLGWSRHKWVNNIVMDLREIGWCGVDWIDLVQNGDQWRAHVNTVKNWGMPSSRMLLPMLYLAHWFIPPWWGDTFLQNIISYKSHAVSHPRRRHSS